MTSFDEMIADELRRQRDLLQRMNYSKAVREIDDTHPELLNAPDTTTSHAQPAQADVAQRQSRQQPDQCRAR